jgi:hypothetical protein
VNVAQELNAFVAWWLHELRDTWVAVSERVAPQRAQHFIVDLSRPRAAIRRRGATEALVEFACGEQGELPDVQSIWPDGAPSTARATVVLPEAKVLTCEIRLPPLAERDVNRALELQLERKLPLSRDQLYVDWRVREILPDRSRLIDVLVARRTTVDRVRDSVRAWGWRAVAVTHKEADTRQRLNLLPPPTRRLSFDVGQRERYLAWGAAALLLLCVTIGVAKAWMERASVRDELVQARAQAEGLEKRRALLATEGKPIAQLRELMAQPSAAEGLAAISSAVPHDSWIYQADIKTLPTGVTAQLEGYTPSATSLLQGLQASSRLEGIELVEAASSGVASGVERVELKARVRSGTAP